MIVAHPLFSPSFERYARSIRLDALEDVRDEAEKLFEIAGSRLSPTFAYRSVFIDAFGQIDGLPMITVEGHQFKGKALVALKNVHRIFPYIATCGNGMEDFDLSPFDMLAPYWLDAIKLQALGCARAALFAHCKKQYHINKPMSLNPGSGNVDIWPIEQMIPLFSLLDQGNPVGVSLSESALMIPNKSIAGVIFFSPGTDYESCAYCERERCPDRRVAFVESL